MTPLGRRVPCVVLCVLSSFAMTAVAMAQDKFFDSNGVQIRYVEEGQGDPVLLIHGFGVSLDRWVAGGVLPNLAPDHRVVAFDVRGHGKSGKPPDRDGYGREIPRDAIRLLDHLGIRRAHVVGHSMGARLTAHLLATHSDRFVTATLNRAFIASNRTASPR